LNVQADIAVEQEHIRTSVRQILGGAGFQAAIRTGRVTQGFIH
jgi:hypothetical protein